jgi:hypothetical protein
MAEPVYLHQVTGRKPGADDPDTDDPGKGDLVRVNDLPDLQERWEAGDAAWRESAEWRCHFHVPVDLAELGRHGIGTTRRQADELLDLALADPGRWGTPDLHLEIETYTWDVLPAAARGPGDVVDGLEREYAHVIARLARAGWEPAQKAGRPR